MSYQALARKWRPKDFSDLVGQEHVRLAIVNGLKQGRLHHAFLFTGTRGVGKTTIARILAKCLNCEQGETDQPCGKCTACTEIDEGRFVDLIEVDAASRTRVDDTRELLDNVQYAPTRARYKVYLIDEVHQLSNHSFNALLKTLEEPPPHVKFLFATTDPQKVPVTVLSRCLQFHLKRLDVSQIDQRIRQICDAESISYDALSVDALARAADGSMRDGLSLLDQAIAFAGGELQEDTVNRMLGAVDHRHVEHLLSALADQDAAGCMQALHDMDEFAPDYRTMLADIGRALHQIAMHQLLPDLSGDGWQVELATKLNPEDVQLYYQIVVQGRADLAMAPDPRTGAEMTVLRLLAFRPQDPGGNRPSSNGSQNQSSGTKPSSSHARGHSAGAATKASLNPVQSTSSPVANHAPAKTAVAEPRVRVNLDPIRQWDGFIEAMDVSGPVKLLAEHLQPVQYDGASLVLSLEEKHLVLNTERSPHQIIQCGGRCTGR